MNRKKKQRNNYEEYWKKRGFDSNKEFLIYQYLCGKSRRWPKINKIDKSELFHTYESWKKHIEGIINTYEEDKLSEFYHFVKLRERACDIDISVSASFLLPFIVALITGITAPDLMKGLMSFAEYKINNWIEFIAVMIGLSIFIMIIFVGMVIILNKVLLPYITSKKETSFWKDCLEIVEEKLKKTGIAQAVSFQFSKQTNERW